jgi:hypothetical protein
VNLTYLNRVLEPDRRTGEAPFFIRQSGAIVTLAGPPHLVVGWSEPDRRAAGLTWHHVTDGQTLVLVPSDLHQAVSHHGVDHAERVARPQALISNYALRER